MSATTGAVLLWRDAIQKRVAEIGRDISRDYAGRSLTIIGILKGSFVFMADLVREIDAAIPVEVDFIAVSSYGDSTESSGTVQVEKDLEVSIEGKDVVLVEDIVDTGLTLFHVYNIVSGRGAASLRVATLLYKPGKSRYVRPLDYVGFEIANHFVVGYGLDYAQRYRNLPDICILNEI
jgi:hypoxanthine phosphoribosyltransferase